MCVNDTIRKTIVRSFFQILDEWFVAKGENLTQKNEHNLIKNINCCNKACKQVRCGNNGQSKIAKSDF